MRFTLWSLLMVISVTCVLLALSSQQPVFIPISVAIGGAAISGWFSSVVRRNALWLWLCASVGGAIATGIFCVFLGLQVRPPHSLDWDRAIVFSLVLGVLAGSLVQITAAVMRLITQSHKVFR